MKQLKQTIFWTLVALVVMATITCDAATKKKSNKVVTKTSVATKNLGSNCFKVDSIVQSHLGTTATDVIFNPNTVTAYRLEGRDTIRENEVEVDKHFVRTAKLGTLNKDYIKLIQYLLINDTANYKVDSIKVKSPYFPEIELVFTKRNQTVSVLISRLDFSWVLISDGKKQFVFNYADKQAINRLFNFIMKQK